MIRIGIICPSEIAFRRFLPALKQCENIQYVGVAYSSKEEWFGIESDQIDFQTAEKIIKAEKEKADRFVENYGGKIFSGYEKMLCSGEIDAVYIPLPPALHYQWAINALEQGLHVFVEKPSTTSLEDTEKLVNVAKEKSLALHENYMFVFHSQLDAVSKVVASGEIGKVRLYRVDFGFPKRAIEDFRYNKKLGGGALLDCGGYTLKYANMLLGTDAKINCANVTYQEGFEVEISGAAQMSNFKREVLQLAFGMDNDYRCNIDIWGSTGTLTSKRILTAPEGFKPSYTISRNGVCETYEMEADDAFRKSIERFMECIQNEHVREKNYNELLHQEKMVDEFMNLAGMK